MIRTAIITAPRPRPTLAQSLGSYRRAGFTDRLLVFSDGGETMVADKVLTLQNEVRLGNKANWIRALSVLFREGEPGDWLMVCEDDVTWAQNAASVLDAELALYQHSTELKRAGVQSLFAPRRVTDAAKRELGTARLPGGWYSYDSMQMGRKTWGAQCYLFTWVQAKVLLSDARFQAFSSDPRKDKNIDAIVGQCVNEMGKAVAYLIPCLVNHDLGEANSSLGYADDRPQLRCDYFKGPRA